MTRATSGSTCAGGTDRLRGVGGQILISETTRSLVGNVVPDGVAVLDLGEKHLKDVQHEHIYEVSVDGAARGYQADEKPLPGPKKSRGDELAERFEERIENYVHQQLDRALGGKEAETNARRPSSRSGSLSAGSGSRSSRSCCSP